MELRLEKILSFIIKKALFITFLISILVLFIVGILYWKYLYLPLNFEPEVTIENKIEEKLLNQVIENIKRKERDYANSLERESKDPFH